MKKNYDGKKPRILCPPNNSNMILEKLEKIQEECIGLGDFHSKMELSRRNKGEKKWASCHSKSWCWLEGKRANVLTSQLGLGSKDGNIKSDGDYFNLLLSKKTYWSISCCCHVMSSWPHGLQHARLPCPSPSARARSNSCPLSQWCHPTISSVVPFSFCLQSFFSSELALCIRWPKYWSFSFSISPSSEYSGLISFRIDWFDLLTVQGTLKSLFQPHSSKTSVLWCSAFFMLQLSHPYMSTRKTIALTRWTFVGKIMSLLVICCLCLS